MAAITLTASEQVALRAVLAAEPVPGSPLPSREFLQQLTRVIPCDEIGVALVDNQGRLLDQISLQDPANEPVDGDSTHGPHYLGVLHWAAHPLAAERCHVQVDPGDGIAVGYRNGSDNVAQIYFGRDRGRYSQRDLALVDLLVPVFQRLLRERPTPALPPSLTLAERRVLMHVAAGRSNARIAEALFIAPSTVRKHLEHSFRKLGVDSRLAAVARLQGRDLPDLDLAERIQRLS